MKTVTVNRQLGLFNIPAGKGYTCLGFEMCFLRTQEIARELGRQDLEPKESEKETLAGYETYRKATDAAKERFDKTGQPLTCGLESKLIGYEGKRVQVVDKHGETRSFVVGKSTGWIPCHIEKRSINSPDGPAVMGTPLKFVKLSGKNKRHS